MTHTEIQRALAALKNRAYAEQPDVFSTVVSLIELLECMYCDHEMEFRDASGDPAEPAEKVMACRKCGYEPTT